MDKKDNIKKLEEAIAMGLPTERLNKVNCDEFISKSKIKTIEIDWSEQLLTIDQIENYLIECDGTITIRKGEFISDIKKMVENHISFLRANSGNKTFMPYYERLVSLIDKIEDRK